MVRTKGLRGFTLAELIVALAIIGVLATIVFLAVSGPRDSADDTKREADIEQMELALRLYKTAFSEYPETDQVNNGSLQALAGLVPGYLGELPDDPDGDGSYPAWNGTTDSEPNTYYYWRADDLPTGCTASEYILWYHKKTGDVGNAPSCLTINEVNSYAIIK